MPGKRPKKSAAGARRLLARTETASPPPTQSRTSFPIVGIGASAGGVEALKQLFRALPATTGVGLVVVQHLAPAHASMLTEILSRETSMPVAEVKDEPTVQPNCVYVIPPDRDMSIKKGVLQLVPREAQRGQHRSIDYFFRSLAEDQGHRAIGVVLSGSANDGTLGLEEIKAQGGITFAQDDSAQFSDMPRSAIHSGCVDFVLPPDEIAAELARIAQHPYVAEPDRPPGPPGDETGATDETGAPGAEAPEASLAQVLQIVRNMTGVDFGHYKPNSLNRRINRRLVLHKLRGLQDYVQFLKRNPLEVEALYQDILINVTSFFRNPEAFEALKNKVFPKLTEDRSRHAPIRIWVVGCSSGEETYSIAMAYSEFAESRGMHVPVQVFATDLNAAGIEKARTGIYSKNIAQDVTPERLRRFFVDIDGAYRIGKPIRDMCVFARHNILTEPPFSRIDLLSCRNMMIYLDQTLQQKVVPLLHYALKPKGFLWLGASETIGTYRELFDVEDARHRIYKKKSAGGHAPATLPAETSLERALEARAGHVPASPVPTPLPNDLHREADRLMLSKYAPAAVLLNSDLDIVQFRGDTSPYLAAAPGKASLNVFKMAREGLLVALRGAIHKARREETTVREENLRVKANGGYRDVSIEVAPLRSAATREACLLVLFEERPTILKTPAKKPRRGAAAGRPDSSDRQIARLTQELAATREYLQSVIEQQEAANEELQSANEEVQSANEELESINEELETSKEEIQSSNEELATVNEELQNRNLELSQSNNDMLNLLASVQLAIVMLGRDLRIRRFTPAAEKLFNLIPSDVGRLISDIKLNLNVADFEKLVEEVIDSVAGKELDVQDAQGRWHLLRIRPYKTTENQIDGAVLVLVDIDNFRRMQENLRQRVAELAGADRAKNEFLAMLAHELRNPLAPLLNGVELLKAGPGDQKLVEQARDLMEHQVRNLARMFDDLLDVARVTQGKVQLRKASVQLAPIIQAAIEVNRHLIGNRDVKLSVDLPPVPVWLEGDQTRLEQVFANIINNAVKFSERGGQVWVKAEAAAGKSPTAVVRVRDEGLGIAPDMLPHVFEMFAQGDHSMGRTQGGLGVGLTLVRNLVEMHGGTVRALSEGLGKGAEFIVELPTLQVDRAPTPSAAPADAAERDRSPRKVLVVDDNVDAADSLALLLRMHGHQAVACHSGEQAVEALSAGSFDVALLDLSMPGMDGLEAARRVRATPQGRPPRLVAVSGYSHEDGRRAAHEAGFDDFLTKPAELNVVLDLLAGL